METLKLTNATMRFKNTEALNNVTLSIARGEITALLGKNGAGKTTLLSVLSGLIKLSDGEALYEESPIFENDRAVGDIAFAFKKDYEEESESVKKYVKAIASLRDHFDQSACFDYLSRFKVPTNKKVNHLSSGQQSALEIALALAANTNVVFFDEIHVGMDAHLREAFYHVLLSAQEASPRTMVISTHYIDEMAHLFDKVCIVESGRVIAHDTQSVLIGDAVLLSGPLDVLKSYETSDACIGCKRDSTMMQCAFSRVPADLPESVHVSPLTLQQYFLMSDKEDANDA